MDTVKCHIQRRIQDFPEGGANPKRGMTTYYLAKFLQQLHENEANWTGRVSKNLLCRSTTADRCVGNVRFVINIKTESTNKTAALDAEIPNG